MAAFQLPPAVPENGDGDGYIMLRSYSELMQSANRVMSMNSCLCFLKLVFYLSLSHTFAIVTLTLTLSTRAVFGFMMVEAITLSGFSTMFMITFGTKVYSYRSLTNSMYTLALALLGDANLDELREADWASGPLFFFLYVGIQVFVVLNMIIAIISDAYTEAEARLKATPDTPLGPEIYRYLRKMLFQLPLVGKIVRRCCINEFLKRQKSKIHNIRVSRRKSQMLKMKSPSSRNLLNEMRERQRMITKLESLGADPLEVPKKGSGSRPVQPLVDSPSVVEMGTAGLRSSLDTLEANVAMNNQLLTDIKQMLTALKGGARANMSESKDESSAAAPGNPPAESIFSTVDGDGSESKENGVDGARNADDAPGKAESIFSVM